MKRILGITMVLVSVSALTVMAMEVKPRKEEVINLGKGVKLDMVLIPSGKFMMGFTRKELRELKVEMQEDYKELLKQELGQGELEAVDETMRRQGKQHEVTLTKPFYMGKYEVTQEQWEAVMGNNPSKNKGAKLPVTDVSWNDCQEFIKKLNAKTDGGYRLPKEAEWEFACRAGTTTAYSYGDSLTKNDANILSDSIKAVGSYKPNAFGLYDLHGNVSELCEDWYEDYPAGELTDPQGPATGTWHVLRGGSFGHLESHARCSLRDYRSPTDRDFLQGLRLARTK
jgi:formylglycine-generating enzyme required for sulfatase activity